MLYMPGLILMFTRYVLAQEFSQNTTTNVVMDVAYKLGASACVFVIQENLGSFANAELLKYRTVRTRSNLFHLTMNMKDVPTLNHNKIYNNKLLYVIMARSHMIQQFLKEEYLSNRKWLLFLDTTTTSLVDYFEDTFIPYDCEFLVAHRTNDAYVLSMLYHIHPSRPMLIHRVATWSDGGNFVWRSDRLRKCEDLQGILLNAAFIPAPVSTESIHFSRRNSIVLLGIARKIFHELQRRLNFTSKLYTPFDREFGIQMENGSWTGMIGMVYEGNVTFGVGPFDLTTERMKVVDYLPPIWNCKVTVYTKEPDMTMSGLKQVLSPLQLDIWLAVILTMMFLVADLASTWYLHNIYSMNSDPNSYSFYESLLYVFGIFCQQGHDVTPRSWPCRLVYLTTYLTAIVVFVGYSATFTSYLSVRRLNHPFTDFKGLLDDGTYNIGVWTGSVYQTYFSDSPDEVLRKIYKKLIQPHLKNARDLFEDMHNLCRLERIGYVMEDTLARLMSHELSCKIVGLQDSYFLVTSSIIVNKKNHFKRLLDKHIQDMRRSGILKKMLNNELRNYIHTYPSVGVTLSTASVFFAILGSGVLLSLVILLLEFMVHRYKSGRT